MTAKNKEQRTELKVIPNKQTNKGPRSERRKGRKRRNEKLERESEKSVRCKQQQQQHTTGREEEERGEEKGGDRATGPYRNYFTIPLFDGSREGKVRLC